jgi:CelD/BcsL family acetyltransferase involved in cellulose biosynthesis
VSFRFSVVEVHAFDEIASLGSEWDHLAALHGWPFAEFAWTHVCARHLCPRSTTSIHYVLRDDRLVAAIPLARTRTLASALTSVGADELYEASPLLTEDATATQILVEHLISKKIPLVLSRILEPDSFARTLKEAAWGKGRVVALRPPGAPFLTLERSVEDFVEGLSANRRSTLRRKRRKLEGSRRLEFHSDYPDHTAVVGALRDFEQLEDAGWKGRHGSAILRRRGFHDFYATALPVMAGSRRVRVDRLTIDSATVAIQLGLVSGGRYFLIKPTYDESLKEHSPGSLLTFEAIKQSIVEGLHTYEFLGSEEPWKLQWASGVRPTGSWAYYPYNLAGVARFSVDALHAANRKLRRTLTSATTDRSSVNDSDQ